MNRPKFQQSIMRLRSARQAGINAVQRQPNTMSAFGNKSLVFGFMSYDHAEKMDLNDITKFVTVRSTLNLSWMNLKQEPVTVSKCYETKNVLVQPDGSEPMIYPVIVIHPQSMPTFVSASLHLEVDLSLVRFNLDSGSMPPSKQCRQAPLYAVIPLEELKEGVHQIGLYQNPCDLKTLAMNDGRYVHIKEGDDLNNNFEKAEEFMETKKMWVVCRWMSDPPKNKFWTKLQLFPVIRVVEEVQRLPVPFVIFGGPVKDEERARTNYDCVFCKRKCDKIYVLLEHMRLCLDDLYVLEFVPTIGNRRLEMSPRCKKTVQPTWQEFEPYRLTLEQNEVATNALEQEAKDDKPECQDMDDGMLERTTELKPEKLECQEEFEPELDDEMVECQVDLEQEPDDGMLERTTELKPEMLECQEEFEPELDDEMVECQVALEQEPDDGMVECQVALEQEPDDVMVEWQDEFKHELDGEIIECLTELHEESEEYMIECLVEDDEKLECKEVLKQVLKDDKLNVQDDANEVKTLPEPLDEKNEMLAQLFNDFKKRNVATFALMSCEEMYKVFVKRLGLNILRLNLHDTFHQHILQLQLANMITQDDLEKCIGILNNFKMSADEN